MLEDGEIGDDDLQSQALKSDLLKTPQVSSPPQKKSKRNKNKQREIKRKKILTTTESSPSTEDDSIVAINDILFSNKDHDSRLDSNELLVLENNNHTDKDERYQQPIFPSLMSTNVSSSWSTPMSTNDKQITQQQQPKSLLDLFLTSGHSLSTQNLGNKVNDLNFIDPVLIEKENKPKINQMNKTQFNRANNTNTTSANKRKIDQNIDSTEKLISTESIEKKLEKKRKYFETQKEKQKIKETKPVREPILCKFFLEGRCQKGAECPFSHNVQLNKKYEVCKFYLNGFCAKEDNCIFMHSEFPCKFYHRKNFATGQKMNQCLHKDACRFSHQPITNPLLQEAFDKHLAETEDNKPTMNANNKTSLLGSPPHINNDIPSLMNISIKPSTNKTASLSPPQSPPQPLLSVNPLMSNRLFNEVKKQPLLATPTFNPPNLMSSNINSLMGTRIQNIPFETTIKPLFNEDVDERSVKPSQIPLIKDKLLQSNDVDERSIKSEQTTKLQTESRNTIKQELIIKIMKSLADETGGVFAQIPKQTLTDLLVKLINSNDSNSDGIDVVINLLTSLSSTTTNTDDSSLNESSSNLQIDLNNQRNYDNGQCSDYDDDEECDLIIEGHIGDMPYQVTELEVPPSKLWYEPSQLGLSNDPTAAADQESDPRIKYYSNITNCTNVANFQQQLQQQHQMLQLQQQQQMTPTSPSSNSSTMSQVVNTNQISGSALSPSGDSTAKSKQNRTADPRLLRNQHNASPTRSISPPNHDQFSGKSLQQQNDLISIQNRQLAANSLLSSLPDLQFPKDIIFNQKNNNLNSLMQQQQNEPNSVKLSFEDYKRKSQKPILNANDNKHSNSSSNLFSVTSSASSSDHIQSSNQSQSIVNTPSLPSIPSYLQAPQSLHELLRNFQS